MKSTDESIRMLQQQIQQLEIKKMVANNEQFRIIEQQIQQIRSRIAALQKFSSVF
jgi:uncharacterized protein YqeY